MNKKLIYNFITIGFILFLINKISNKSLKLIFTDYLNKIKNIIYNIFNINNKITKQNGKNIKIQQNIKNEETKNIENNQKLEKNYTEPNEELNIKIDENDNTNNINQDIYNLLIKKTKNVELPLNVSIPNKCNDNDSKNIKKFLESQYKINNIYLNKDIDFYTNNNIYEIKPINISCNMNLNDKVIKCELEFNLIFQENEDDTIFSSEYNFNKKQGYFTIINFKILNSKEISTQNLNFEKLDTNSIDSLIPDNIFSSEYEKDSSNYTTESQINFDTA